MKTDAKKKEIKIVFNLYIKMFHLQRFFSMEQSPPPADDGVDDSLSGVGGAETDSTSAEG